MCVCVCVCVSTDPRDEAIDGFSYESVTSGYDPSPAHTLMRVYTALGQAAYASMEHFATTVHSIAQTPTHTHTHTYTLARTHARQKTDVRTHAHMRVMSVTFHFI